MSSSTTTLLEQIVAQFPLKRAKLGAAVPDEYAQLKVGDPVPVRRLATFDPDNTRPLSPMLDARFHFASTVLRFSEEWLAADAMTHTMRDKGVRSMHLSLRKHWEGSAPMLYPDKNLGLFSFTHGVPESLVYLVWTHDEEEPQLWKYSGMDSRVFKNLEALLQWYLA